MSRPFQMKGPGRACLSLGLVRRLRRKLTGVDLSSGKRQLSNECSASTGFALRPDDSAVLLNDAVADREAKTGALAYLFCGEEGVENLSQVLGRYPRSIIGYTNDYPPAARFDLGFQCQCPLLTAGADGLLGIDNNIQEDLLELVLIHVDSRKITKFAANGYVVRLEF